MTVLPTETLNQPETPSDFKQQVILYSKILDQKNLVNSLEGNISIYDRKNNLLYITPSGTRKIFLDEDSIAVLKGDNQIEGNRKRSSEYLLHKVALEARQDCNAVVHVHAPFLTAYAYCQMSIEMKCSTTFTILHDDIPCIPYGEPGSLDITNGLTEALQNHNLVLLGNHGLVCVGKDLEQACSIVEATEEVMKIYYLAKQMQLHNLSDKELESMKLAKRPGGNK